MTRLFILGLFCGTSLFADQIFLKNGDRLTGSVEKLDGNALRLKSDLAGPVTIAWDSVETITTSAPLYVRLQDGRLVSGKVKTENQKLVIGAAPSQPVTAERAAVKSLRSETEEAAYERLEHPGILELWAGSVAAGLSKAQGNTGTTAVNISMNAVRAARRDKVTTNFTTLYASNTAAGASSVTAKATRGGVRYDFNVCPKTFVFGASDFENDRFQKLDLRFIGSSGFGYHAFKDEKTGLDTFGGLSLDREIFSTGLMRTSAEARIGEDLAQKIGSSSSLAEKLTFSPNLSEPGEYRMAVDTSAITNIKKWIGWQFTVSDRYISNPLPGTKKNDVLLTTGVRLTFAR